MSKNKEKKMNIKKTIKNSLALNTTLMLTMLMAGIINVGSFSLAYANDLSVSNINIALPATIPNADNTSATANGLNKTSLDNYLEYLKNNNLDIQKAQLNYQSAQLNYQSAKIDTHPDNSTSVQANKTNHQSTNYDLNSSLSYQVDIWGQLKENEKAKLILIDSAQASFEDTLNNTLYKFISNYQQLAYTNEKIAIEKKKLEIYQKKLVIYDAQFKNGLITSDQVLILRNSLADTQTSIASLIDSKNTLINTLNVLLNNKTDESILKEPDKLEDIVILNHPEENLVEALQKNPSVNASLLNVLSDNHMVSYNEKSYYPTITLGASLATSALKISSLLVNPITTLLSTISFNFNFNEIKNNIDISKNNREIDMTTYKQTYLALFNNIKEQLAKYSNNQSAYEQMSQEYDNYQKVVNLYTIQYQAGYLAYATLLDEQILLLNSQENKLTYQLNKQQILSLLNYYII
jgi:outer membrane protein TolC